MRKLLLFFFIAFICVNNAYAKWRPLDLSELIQHSDTIVIAELLSEKSQTKTTTGKTQIVLFKSINIIKGKPNSSFSIYGSAEHICKAQFFFPNKPGDQYLLFLRSTESGIYHVVNGQFGALIISNKSVNWFTDTSSYSRVRKQKSLSDVLQQLQEKGLTKP